MAEEPLKTESTTKGAGKERAFIGLILVLVGIVFLLRNVEMIEFDNWWALFILIPAIASFSSAWRSYQANGGQFSKDVRSRIVGGLFPLTVALIFLFNLDFGEMWPLFIVLAGIAVLFSG